MKRFAVFIALLALAGCGGGLLSAEQRRSIDGRHNLNLGDLPPAVEAVWPTLDFESAPVALLSRHIANETAHLVDDYADRPPRRGFGRRFAAALLRTQAEGLKGEQAVSAALFDALARTEDASMLTGFGDAEDPSTVAAGMGFTFFLSQDRLNVYFLSASAAAHSAGLRGGDAILAVDGETILDRNRRAVILQQRLPGPTRGPVGAVKRIQVERPGGAIETFDVPLADDSVDPTLATLTHCAPLGVVETYGLSPIALRDAIARAQTCSRAAGLRGVSDAATPFAIDLRAVGAQFTNMFFVARSFLPPDATAFRMVRRGVLANADTPDIVPETLQIKSLREKYDLQTDRVDLFQTAAEAGGALCDEDCRFVYDRPVLPTGAQGDRPFIAILIGPRTSAIAVAFAAALRHAGLAVIVAPPDWRGPEDFGPDIRIPVLRYRANVSVQVGRFVTPGGQPMSSLRADIPAVGDPLLEAASFFAAKGVNETQGGGVHVAER